MDFVTILAAITVAVIAWVIDFKAGIVVTIAVIGYILYKLFPSIAAFRGKQAYQAGDCDNACKLYERAIKTGRAGVGVKLEYSDLLMQMGRIDEAKDYLDKLLRNKLPADFAKSLKLRRCMAYYRLGDKDEAISDAEEIYDSGFKTTYLYAVLGYLKLDTDGKSNETFDFCREAYEYNDSDRDIADNYALALYYKGEYGRAQSLYNVLTEKYPMFVEGYYHGAMVEYALGNYKKALNYIEKTEECKWSPLTTVTKEEISKLKSSAASKTGVN